MIPHYENFILGDFSPKMSLNWYIGQLNLYLATACAYINFFMRGLCNLYWCLNYRYLSSAWMDFGHHCHQPRLFQPSSLKSFSHCWESSQVVRQCRTSRCLIYLPTYDFLYLNRVSYSKVFQPRLIVVPYPVQRAFSHKV